MSEAQGIERLLRAAGHYYQCALEEEQGRVQSNGEWGYWGSPLIEAKERAAEDVQQQLRQIINVAVADALQSHGIVVQRNAMD